MGHPILVVSICMRKSIRIQKINYKQKRERSGSVVECLTWDRGAAGSSLNGVNALWSLSKTHLSNKQTQWGSWSAAFSEAVWSGTILFLNITVFKTGIKSASKHNEQTIWHTDTIIPHSAFGSGDNLCTECKCRMYPNIYLLLDMWVIGVGNHQPKLVEETSWAYISKMQWCTHTIDFKRQIMLYVRHAGGTNWYEPQLKITSLQMQAYNEVPGHCLPIEHLQSSSTRPLFKSVCQKIFLNQNICWEYSKDRLNETFFSTQNLW